MENMSAKYCIVRRNYGQLFNSNTDEWFNMKVTGYLSIISASLTLLGCATGSVQMIGDVKTYKTGDCLVSVFQTKTKAIENGLKTEVCVVEGSSAFSFDHSIEGAIKNNISKICECGVNKAYVKAAHTGSQMGIKGVSYVNLIGFK